VSIIEVVNEANKLRVVLENQRKDSNRVDMSEINQILETNPTGGEA
jgi:hypothetical protein